MLRGGRSVRPHEGIVPAPETTHAIRAAIDEALKAQEEGKSPTILFNLRGHGHFDMQAYTDYFAGKLVDQDYDPKALEASLCASAEGGGGVRGRLFDGLEDRSGWRSTF